METKGFLGSLFDFTFTEFVTTRIIKLLYVVVILFAALGALGILVSGLDSIATGIGALLVSPLIFLLVVLLGRIWLELIIVTFRIAENTGRLVDLAREKERDFTP